MNRTLITAAMVTEIPGGKDAPAEIVYLPEGKHTLTPKSHPKGIKVHLPPEKGEAVAAAFNADLAKRGTVRGWCDFEHTRKYPVSFYPTAFRYEPGTGIMAAADWSSSGRRAVEGRDVRYFSPEFFIDDHGVPTGLPDRGPLGGLVTEPAFREIGAIAASVDIDPDESNDSPAMSKLIFAALAISAAHADAETLAVQEIEKLKSDARSAKDELARVAASLKTVESERDALKTKVTAAETAAKDAATKRAGDLVTAAIADGRIAAKDEEKANKFRERIAAGDAFAEEMLAGLPKANGDLGKTIVTASGDRQPVVPAGTHAFEVKARALVTAGEAEDLDTALSVVAASEPALYGDYLKTLNPAG